MDAGSREAVAYRAARMYYGDDRTMESIATELSVSRATVSRLLRDARDSGIVQISVRSPHERTAALAQRIREMHGVEAHVAASEVGDSHTSREDVVAQLAAEVLDDLVVPDSVVALAWGRTTTTVAAHLPRRPVPGLQVVQLNGAVNSHPEGVDPGYGSGASTVEAFGRAYGARAHLFAVPAFFDYEETRTALWRERSTRRVLDLQRRAALAVFGVGTFTGGIPSQVYSSGYLSSTDLYELNRHRVVGDVCTVFLRPDGSYDGIDLNRRCSGPVPPQLRTIPRRLCVVNGPHKVPALRAALAAGVATNLVLDQVSATHLLEGAA